MNNQVSKTDIESSFQSITSELSPEKKVIIDQYIIHRVKTAVKNVRLHTFTDDLGNPQKGGFEMGRS